MKSTRPALDGIRILDCSSVVFGPYATQVLADYGADVLKIESPEGDSTRFTGPAHEHGRSAIFSRAIVTSRIHVFNQRDETVMTYTATRMLAGRPQA